MGNEQEFTYDWKKFKEEYRTKEINTGAVERLDYVTNTYDEPRRTITKSLHVYLPEGYNPQDEEKRYNIMYLMHGGGENENLLLGGPGQNTELKNILDNMIENGELEPLIVVTPTFYVDGNQDAGFLVRNFYKELMSDVIPMVERIYSTYAKNITLEALKESRSHRAFGGFSMGSACTWYIFMHCLDYFQYFMPLSGDCWAIEEKGGSTKSEETAQLLADAAKQQGYQKEDYYIFCATGREDIAYDHMSPQIEEMKQRTQYFAFTPDGKNGNFAFYVKAEATHWWHYVYEYIYVGLPFFFYD